MFGYCQRRIEDAWTNLLMSSSLSESIESQYFIRGTDFVDEKVEESLHLSPVIVTTCASIEEVEMGTGVYRAQAAIQYIYPYSGSASGDNRNELLEEVCERVLGDSNIIASLMGYTTKLYIYDATFAGQSETPVGDSIINTTLIDMVVRQTV